MRLGRGGLAPAPAPTEIEGLAGALSLQRGFFRLTDISVDNLTSQIATPQSLHVAAERLVIFEVFVLTLISEARDAVSRLGWGLSVAV